MAHGIRTFVAKFILSSLNLHEASLLERLACAVQVVGVSKKSDVQGPNLKVPINVVEELSGKNVSNQSWKHDSQTKVTCDGKNIHVCFNSQKLSKEVINDVTRSGHSYGLRSPYHCYYTTNGIITKRKATEKVIVEYSSPNIAKPFHAGHLRSTIIGNFVANINEALGNHVVRINYLGDWGTQFGLLSIGYKKYGVREKLKYDAMKHLFDVYVKVNKDVEDEEKEEGVSITRKSALEHLKNMETGSPDLLEEWKHFRNSSIDDYSKVYKRLGVCFDEYHGESMYYEAGKDISRTADKLGYLQTSKEGVSFIDLSDILGGTATGNLLKSDGATLYLTRDLAAIIDRRTKYRFDKIYYVVENGQSFHFQQMVAILKKLKYDWIADCENLHVKFGRVSGMSSRRGNVVFLSDILDEAKIRMMEIMSQKSTSKISTADNIEETADILGISGVIVQDLKQRKSRNYEFNWNRMLDNNGDTGVFLQYGHARLSSLEKNCGLSIDVKCSLDYLEEPETIRLCQHLAKYDEILNDCYSTLEAHTLVNYLFKLVHLSNAAIHVLPVKGSKVEVGQARLLMFYATKIVLGGGLKLLGITPLHQM